MPGVFTLFFDGELLKLRARDRLFAAQANGSAWTDAAVGRLRDLHALSLRLNTNPVELGIWQGALGVENRRIRLL